MIKGKIDRINRIPNENKDILLKIQRKNFVEDLYMH